MGKYDDFDLELKKMRDTKGTEVRSGTVVGIITFIYCDAAKDSIAHATKTCTEGTCDTTACMSTDCSVSDATGCNGLARC